MEHVLVPEYFGTCHTSPLDPSPKGFVYSSGMPQNAGENGIVKVLMKDHETSISIGQKGIMLFC